MAKRTFSPLIEEIKDFPPAIEAFERLKERPYSFFLDSAADAGKLGRYSFLGCDPFLVFRSKGSSVTLAWDDGTVGTFRSNPFHVLKDIVKKYGIVATDGRTPFPCGGVGYFAYDMKDFVERLPAAAIDDLEIPDCIVAFYDVVMTYDNSQRKAYIAGYPFSKSGVAGQTRRVKERMKRFKERVLGKAQYKDHHRFVTKLSHSVRSNFSKEAYMESVRRAKAYIKKGDIYQVNLSQRFEAELPCEPFGLYRRLRQASPAPFSSYLNFGDVAILSSSPERFLLKKGRYVETRPIKGTRPRGYDPVSDLAMEAELLASEKDRAEHVMIVDLERNDLGRICEYGSVKPSEFVILEKYSTVFHLVSTVSGTLRKDADAVDCLLATFPGGSITGAPKIRAMEIIDELEPVRRSVYTGAIGYLSFDGNMDTSIVIRTFLAHKGMVYFQTGGGIVADSDPEKEYEETLDKARALMQSLGVSAVKEERRSVLCQV